MSKIGQRGIHYLQRLNSASFTSVSASSIEKGQNRVIDASLTLIRERAKLKVHNFNQKLRFFFFLGLFVMFV